MKEIQSIVAGGTSENTMLLHRPALIKSNVNVHDIVSSVQRLLTQEVEAKKNATEENNVLDTPDVSSSWSSILPAIFGNTGDDIQPIKKPQQIVMTTDAVVLDTTTEREKNKNETQTQKQSQTNGNHIQNNDKIKRKPVTEQPSTIFVTRRKQTQTAPKPTTTGKPISVGYRHEVTTKATEDLTTTTSRFVTRRRTPLTTTTTMPKTSSEIPSTTTIATTSTTTTTEDPPRTPVPSTTTVMPTTTPLQEPKITKIPYLSEPFKVSVLKEAANLLLVDAKTSTAATTTSSTTTVSPLPETTSKAGPTSTVGTTIKEAETSPITVNLEASTTSSSPLTIPSTTAADVISSAHESTATVSLEDDKKITTTENNFQTTIKLEDDFNNDMTEEMLAESRSTTEYPELDVAPELETDSPTSFDSMFSLNQIIESLRDDPSTEHMGLLMANRENFDTFLSTTVFDRDGTTEIIEDKNDGVTETNEDFAITTERYNSEIESVPSINDSNVYKSEVMFVEEKEPLIFDLPTTTELVSDNEETTVYDENIPIAQRLTLENDAKPSQLKMNPTVEAAENFIENYHGNVPDSLAVENIRNENEITKIAALQNLTLTQLIHKTATVASQLSNDGDHKNYNDAHLKSSPMIDKFHLMQIMDMVKNDKSEVKPIGNETTNNKISYETSIVKKTQSISEVHSKPTENLSVDDNIEMDSDPNMIRVPLLSNEKDSSTEISVESDVHEEIHAVRVKMPTKSKPTQTIIQTTSQISVEPVVGNIAADILSPIGMIDREMMEKWNITMPPEDEDDDIENEDDYMNLLEDNLESRTTESSLDEDEEMMEMFTTTTSIPSLLIEELTTLVKIEESSTEMNEEGTTLISIENTTLEKVQPTTPSYRETSTENYPKMTTESFEGTTEFNNNDVVEEKNNLEEIPEKTTMKYIEIMTTEKNSDDKDSTEMAQELSTPLSETTTLENIKQDSVKTSTLSDFEEVPTTAENSTEKKLEIDDIIKSKKPLENLIAETTTTSIIIEAKNDENAFINLGEATTAETSTIKLSRIPQMEAKKHTVVLIPNDRSSIPHMKPVNNYRPSNEQKIYHINNAPSKSSIQMPTFNTLKNKVQNSNRGRPLPTSFKLEAAPQQALGLEESTINASEDILEFAKLCNELAFTFWKSLTSEGISSARSLVISPFALTSMLAMIFLGARGSTSGEMNEMLRLDDMVTFNPHLIFRNITDSVENSKDAGLATSAFVRELFSDRSKGKILSFYKDKAQQFYSGHVEEVNFSIINDIIRRRTNLLVKRHTWGKINEYLKTNNIWLNPPLAGITANIYQTDCTQATVNERDGEMFFQVLPAIRQRRLIPVPAAVWKSGFTAGYDPELDATVVAFGGSTNVVSTIFIMPGQQGHSVPGDNLERLESMFMANAISKNAWKRLLMTLMERPGLEVQIPRFSHRSFINATNGLLKMGLNDLFNFDKADLRGLTGSSTRDIFISDMIQINTFSTCGEDKIHDQHHVEMYPAPPIRERNVKYDRQSEELEMDSTNFDYDDVVERSLYDPLFDQSYLELPLPLRPRQARLPEAPRLRFDKPFLYIVRHNPTGMILYMGRFNPRLLP